VRIKPLKEPNNPLGGRVYFVERDRVKEIINCLEKRTVLVEAL
jgi:pimeloyl-CoA synthetase